KRMFWYGQDTWRVTSKLTLNYGLRWEWVFPETVNAPGNGAQLDLRTGEMAVFGVGKTSMHGIQEMSWKHLAPRLGVAYTFGEKMVIRAADAWGKALPALRPTPRRSVPITGDKSHPRPLPAALVFRHVLKLLSR